MKVTSKRKVVLCQDREGSVEEFIQIQIKQTKKDDDLKEYLFEARDFMLLENGILSDVKNRYGESQIKTYHKTYAEYDAERASLLEMFPSDLTGSALDDYLLLMALMYSLKTNPIYGLIGEDWE